MALEELILDGSETGLSAGEKINAAIADLNLGTGVGDMRRDTYDNNDSGVVDDAEKVNSLTVETAVPSGALFTDTVYDDTTISAAVALNTAKVTDLAHPLVETAVPTGALFTDTVYDDTDIQDEVDLNTTHSAVVTGNPHTVTQTEVGLGNVDNTSDADKPVSTSQQSVIDSKVMWAGPFSSSSSYEINDMVRDGSWTGVANTQTSDRISPQTIGGIVDSIDLGTLMADVSYQGVVAMTHTYTMTKTGYIKAIQIHLPDFTENTVTKLTIANLSDLSESAIYTNIIVPTNSWTTVDVGNLIVAVDDIVSIKFEVYNTVASAAFDVLSTSNVDTGTPANRQTNIDNLANPTVIEVDHTGTTDSNNQVVLDGVDVGAIVTVFEAGDASKVFQGEVEIVDVSSTSSTKYTLINVSTGGEVKDNKALVIRFEEPIEVDTHYSVSADYYATDIDYATVETSLAYGGSDQGDIDDAYGINIKFQEAIISSDWDIISSSQNGITGITGTPSGDYTYFYNKAIDIDVPNNFTGTPQNEITTSPLPGGTYEIGYSMEMDFNDKKDKPILWKITGTYGANTVFSETVKTASVQNKKSRYYVFPKEVSEGSIITHGIEFEDDVGGQGFTIDFCDVMVKRVR